MSTTSDCLDEITRRVESKETFTQEEVKDLLELTVLAGACGSARTTGKVLDHYLNCFDEACDSATGVLNEFEQALHEKIMLSGGFSE